MLKWHDFTIITLQRICKLKLLDGIRGRWIINLQFMLHQGYRYDFDNFKILNFIIYIKFNNGMFIWFVWFMWKIYN